jgi:uncharacterized protein YbaA (DUF1428 family)
MMAYVDGFLLQPRSHRDSVNKRVMKDPQMLDL